MNKTTMCLVWHNCETCTPEEENNAHLYMTNGDTPFVVEWDNGSWLDCDGRLIGDVSGFWWADLDLTTERFFNLGLGMKE